MDDPSQPSLRRNRVPLSCGPCRSSKQKCDRGRPCSQCTRKGLPHQCRYADRPERARHGKGVAARLQKLESLVRTMMDGQDDGEGVSSRDPRGGGRAPSGTGGSRTEIAVREEGGDDDREGESEGEDRIGQGGKVVSGRRATSYVGATHFMAILEDIEDLKNYFEDPEEPETECPPSLDESDLAPEFLLFSAGSFQSKEDLLNVLPEKPVIDLLIVRYFASLSTTKHLIHRPTFSKQYAQFWKDPQGTPINWIALLFMVLAVGLLFSPTTEPHEGHHQGPGVDLDRLSRVKSYRAAAAWALVYGRYLQAGPQTLPPLFLFMETEFLLTRGNQMRSYVLFGVIIRLMLKVGLHRDPSKLANVSPFEGEMRRRMWCSAITYDLLVSFHVGLPSMIQAVESDTAIPRNLVDEDLTEDCAELPPSRPPTEYTPLTYHVNKCLLSKVFGQIARNAHALTTPTYSEVLRLDRLLLDTWNRIPSTMMVRPLDESITDPPQQIIQRFGLASLFEKGRCVLHRRFILEPVPRKEHAYSRRTCIEAALQLLQYQRDLWQGMRPGHMLSSGVWFVSSLAVHDFLLAAMIVYICLESPHYSRNGDDNGWVSPGASLPSKRELVEGLKTSHTIWLKMAAGTPEFDKLSGLIRTMLAKLDFKEAEIVGRQPRSQRPVPNHSPVFSPSFPGSGGAGLATPSTATTHNSDVEITPLIPNFEQPWAGPDNGLDWRNFENLVMDVSGYPQEQGPQLDPEVAAWLDMQQQAEDLQVMDFTMPGTGA